MASPSGNDSIAQQASDCHRPDAAWNRRDSTSPTARLVERNIAHQARCTLRSDNAVYSNIDDCCTVFDPFTANEFRKSDGSYNDICPPDNIR